MDSVIDLECVSSFSPWVPRRDNPHDELCLACCSCLLYEPTYYASASEGIEFLKQACIHVVSDGQDPEFILQLALYTRDMFGLRSTPLFLLAMAAAHRKLFACRPFLVSYMKQIIKHPGDLLEASNLVCGISAETAATPLPSKPPPLPAAFRRGVKACFLYFDEYQLAKHNRDSTHNKKHRQRRKAGKTKENEKRVPKTPRPHRILIRSRRFSSNRRFSTMARHEDGADSADGGIARPPSTWTLRKLVRSCHVSQPAELIAKLLRVRDKTTGKALRLATPETWEARLSACGSKKANKALAWQDLLSSRKLPILAFLKNLRNMIQADVQPEAIRPVLDSLKNSHAIHTKILPHQLLSTHHEMMHLLSTVSVPETKNKTKPLVAEIMDALDVASCNSAMSCLPPMRGRHVVFVDVSGSMKMRCNTLGGFTTAMDVAMYLGLMCKYCMEDCELRLFSSPTRRGDRCDILVDSLKPNTILGNMELLREKACQLGGCTDFPYEVLLDMIENKTIIQSMVVFSDEHFQNLSNVCVPEHLSFTKKTPRVEDILAHYRQHINPDFLFVSVNLCGPSTQLPSLLLHDESPNNLQLSGSGPGVLTFIGQRLLNQVESVRAYAAKTGH